MSAINMAALTENASRLGQRLQETFTEHTRDLARLGGVGGSSLEGLKPGQPDEIRRQLDSSSDRDKLIAMKHLVGMISKTHGTTTPYFAPVVKCVASPSLELRKLVYIFLLHYAPTEPDLALLSINTFQRDLNDHSALIRAMALRVLSGMQVGMIGTIVVMAIKKCASDISPYVRKAAGLAVPKCYSLDESHLHALLPILNTLLSDRSPLPLGTAAAAFAAVCPDRLDLLHPHFRRLCRVLVDVDEWGQVQILSLLVRYARTMLPRPAGGSICEDPADDRDDGAAAAVEDKDIRLLLTSAKPLFMSMNPAVALAAVRVFLYLAPRNEAGVIVGPLVRLLHASKEVERVVLVYLCVVAKFLPTQLAPSFPLFLLRTSDSPGVSASKIRLLLAVLNAENSQAILREFVDASTSPDSTTAAHAIEAIGTVAMRIPEHAASCVTALVGMVGGDDHTGDDTTITSAVLVLKHLVQTQLSTSPSSSPAGVASALSIIAHLARRIEDIRQPDARACVFWLVGQYAGVAASSSFNTGNGGGGIPSYAPDILRIAAKGFATSSSSIVKLQTVTLAAKLLLLTQSGSEYERVVGLLARYVFSLARYDADWDVRDRGRVVGKLVGAFLSGESGATNGWGEEGDGESGGGGAVVLRREQVSHVLFGGKKGIVVEDDALETSATVGSLELVLADGKPHMTTTTTSGLPDWLEKGMDGSLRDTEADRATPPAPVVLAQSSAAASSSSTRTSSVLTAGTTRTLGGVAVNDLDKFYEDDGEEESESESEDESEEEESEGSEEEQEGNGDVQEQEKGSQEEGAESESAESEGEGEEEKLAKGYEEADSTNAFRLGQDSSLNFS